MTENEELRKAIEIVRTRITTDEVIYAGFLSSIESALCEAKPYTKEHDLARVVLDRIIGEEQASC